MAGAIGLKHRSVQSYVGISPFSLGKSGFPSAVDNRFCNYRLRDSLRNGCAMKKVGWSSILVAAMLLAVAVLAEAQQAKKVPRIGYLLANFPTTSPARREAFRQGLRELGYVEGKNIVIEYRYAEGKR